MKTLKLALPALIALAGLFAATVSYGKPEYRKKEKKGCTFCHIAAGKKDLNDTGKYYKDHDHSLDGYKK